MVHFSKFGQYIYIYKYVYIYMYIYVFIYIYNDIHSIDLFANTQYKIIGFRILAKCCNPCWKTPSGPPVTISNSMGSQTPSPNISAAWDSKWSSSDSVSPGKSLSGAETAQTFLKICPVVNSASAGSALLESFFSTTPNEHSCKLWGRYLS